MIRARQLLALLLTVPACASAREPRYTPVESAEGIAAARAELAKLRARLVPDAATGYRIAALMTEGRSGKTMSSRGALAVRPPDALRMQLVGPAGALALDVWIAGDHARLAIPAIDRVERVEGDAPLPGRPIAFLRWWMLHPLDGELTRVLTDETGGTRYLLRARDGAEIDARVDASGRTFHVERRSSRDEEVLDATDPPCGVARYHSREAHLTVDVTCEGAAPPPSARAFDDPERAR